MNESRRSRWERSERDGSTNRSRSREGERSRSRESEHNNENRSSSPARDESLRRLGVNDPEEHWNRLQETENTQQDRWLDPQRPIESLRTLYQNWQQERQQGTTPEQNLTRAYQLRDHTLVLMQNSRRMQNGQISQFINRLHTLAINEIDRIRNANAASGSPPLYTDQSPAYNNPDDNSDTNPPAYS